MIFRNLSSGLDWLFGKGVNDYARKDEAIGLNIKTRVLSWLGDCFFAADEGIDWTNRLGSKNQRELLEIDLKRVILQSEGVTGLVTFDTQLIGRKFTANYTVTTIFSKSYQDTIEIGAFNG